jgi:hypothetical protein
MHRSFILFCVSYTKKPSVITPDKHLQFLTDTHSKRNGTILLAFGRCLIRFPADNLQSVGLFLAPSMQISE